ncbi:MAG: carboxypeptidase regulatory-like domain-containing protein [Elusimicrobiota bacterium]
MVKNKILKTAPLLAAGFFLTLAAAPLFANNSDLNVVVQNAQGQPVPGAAVFAIVFNAAGPDPNATQISSTDATGTANFSGQNGNTLTDADNYTILASSQGFAPSAAQQFGNGPLHWAANPAPSTPTVTITLSSAGVSGVGEIDANVTNATAGSLVFGQVGLQGGGSPAAFGLLRANGSGAGVLQAYNVAFALAGTYNVSAFVPGQNASVNAAVNSNLNSGSPYISGIALNFTNGVPPQTNLSQQSGGNLSALGVVTDTNSIPLPGIQVNFNASYTNQYGQQQNDFRGFQTDQNGNFQLYGLVLGATYYAQVFGSCNPGTGQCYQGFQDQGPTPGVHDVAYLSSASVVSLQIQLLQSQGGGGTMAVQIMGKDAQGNVFPMPQTQVNVFPDGSPWQINGSPGCAGTTASNQGNAQFNVQTSTGFAFLRGLAPGNYLLSACSSFGCYMFNNGPDGKFNGGPNSNYGHCGGDDFRVTIDTTNLNGAGNGAGDVEVYDSSGDLLSQSSTATVVVPIPTGAADGLIKGTLTFPSGGINLAQDPITISLQPNCQNGNCQGIFGGFFVLNSASTGPTVNYDIPVSTGESYYFNINSSYWGAVLPGGNQIQPDLTSTGTVVVNLSFAPAGRILGNLIKPDGSAYTLPSNSFSYIGINAEGGGNSWGQAQLNQDGSFIMGGLLPGVYHLAAQAQSNFPYAVKQPLPTVTVTANQDSNQNVYLDYGVSVLPVVSTTTLPPFSIVGNCPQNGGGECPPESWGVFALPQGTPWTAATASNLLNGSNNVSGIFNFTASSGTVNNPCNGAYMTAPGFCYNNALAVAPTGGTAYDFYAARMGKFDQQDLAGGSRIYLVFEASDKNVAVSRNQANTTIVCASGSCPGGPAPQTEGVVQQVSFGPPTSLAAMPQAVVAGTVTASNIITQQQFRQLGGDFNRFLTYLPWAFLYDSSGTLKAMGMVTPSPLAVGPLQTQLNQAVGSGNYAQFQALMSTGTGGWGPVGYEIRGLPADTTYQMVLTSFNYPPFKEQIYTGSAGSTTTWNVNLDANPGESLSGVVESTNSIAVAAASVLIQAPGIPDQTVATDSLGNWQINGLAAGSYTITVTAAGYVLEAQSVSVSGSGSLTVPAFLLPISDSFISGRIYTNDPICAAGDFSCIPWVTTGLSGAAVLAYDDTVNESSPSAVLPLVRAVSNSSGVYELNGLQAGDVYKVFADAHAQDGRGYYVSNETFTATAGGIYGADFALTPKPLTVNVYGHPNGSNYEFDITNYQEFSSGAAWIGTSPFSKATSTDVSSGFAPSPGNGLVLDYPTANLTPGIVYILHLEAQPTQPGVPLVIREIPFGIDLPNNACQDVDESLLGDGSDVNAQGLPLNEAALDSTGQNGSGISFPAGSIIPSVSTGAVPSMCMSSIADSTGAIAIAPQQVMTASGEKSVLGVLTPMGLVNVPSLAAFASNIYQIQLSSINYTSRGIDLTFAYDQTEASNLGDLAVFSYSTATVQWTQVPGTQTIDPVHGTITISQVKSLSSVLGLSADSPLRAEALSSGGGYRPNANSSLRPDDLGLFAILHPSALGTGANTFSGGSFKIFNFPNPFNLSQKTVSLNTTSSNPCASAPANVTTSGTVIKFEVPTNVSGGHAVLRIYTISGRLVTALDQGSIAGGQCYYTTWDGHNRQGAAVADGIYYGILSVPGVSSRTATFKMAVIK